LYGRGTDLEKLIFTIKNAEKMVKLPKNKRPLFMQEDWLDSALHELDTRNFTPEKYEAYMRYMVRQADIQRREEEDAKRNNQQGLLKGKREGKIEGKIEGKTDVIKMLLLHQVLPVEVIAQMAQVEVQFVEDIKSKLSI
jgi:hypothetical protein